MRKLPFYAFCLFTFLTLSACGSIGKTLVVSGESLKGIGAEFIQVAAIYKEGCDVTKVIPAAQCAKFRAFGLHFQKSYPLVVQLWEVARSAQDVAAQDRIILVVLDLAKNLSSFAVSAVATLGGK